MWVMLADVAGDEEDFGCRGGDANMATKGAALGAFDFEFGGIVLQRSFKEFMRAFRRIARAKRIAPRKNVQHDARRRDDRPGSIGWAVRQVHAAARYRIDALLQFYPTLLPTQCLPQPILSPRPPANRSCGNRAAVSARRPAACRRSWAPGSWRIRLWRRRSPPGSDRAAPR